MSTEYCGVTELAWNSSKLLVKWKTYLFIYLANSLMAQFIWNTLLSTRHRGEKIIHQGIFINWEIRHVKSLRAIVHFYILGVGLMWLPGKVILFFIRSLWGGGGVMATISIDMWAVWTLILNSDCMGLNLCWHRNPVARGKSVFEEVVLCSCCHDPSVWNL